MNEVRWGVVGPGAIAHSFVKDLSVVADARVVAVASRDLERATRFAAQYDIARAYGATRELLHDDEVDAVYVATPHTDHLATAMAALRAGKAVLCEKPLTVNEHQARELVEEARARGVFLMEAMWTRCLPIMEVVADWLERELIGEPRMVQASFGFRGGDDPLHRLLNPALAGGSVLDVGVYPLAFALWVFGVPADQVAALGHRGATGVDEQVGMLLRFARGQIAVLSSGVRTETESNARIFGTKGRIHLDPTFWNATQATLVRGEEREVVTRPLRAHGFEYEIEEVARCLRAGLAESPKMPHAHTIEVIRLCDEIRRQVGVTYPFE